MHGDGVWLDSLEGQATWLAVGLAAIRIGAMLVIAPVFGRRTTPWRVKAMLGLALTFLIAPSQARLATVTAEPTQWIAWGFREAAIGLALGLAVLLVASGIGMAGELIGNALGLRAASGDASENGEASGRLLEWVAFAVLLAGGGHRLVMDSLLATFATLPLATSETISVRSLVEIASHSFRFAVCAAAPIFAASIAAQVLLAMLARSQPVLRNAAIHSSTSVLVGVGAWLLTFGAIGMLATHELEVVLEGVKMLLEQAKEAAT